MRSNITNSRWFTLGLQHFLRLRGLFILRLSFRFPSFISGICSACKITILPSNLSPNQNVSTALCNSIQWLDRLQYLLKDTPREQLLLCTQTVQAGRSFIPPDVGVRLAERMNTPELSKREREALQLIPIDMSNLEIGKVLQLIPIGMSNLEIGKALQIKEGTVKSHVNNILSKLNVRDRTQAVIVALKRGLIRLA